MSNLIERLRDLYRRYAGGVADEAADGCDDAADEIERLRKLIDGAAETGEIYERKLSRCEAENAALSKRLAEAERDAARYRWLRDQFRLLNADMGGNHAWSYGHHVRLRGPTIDAAIDAAMGEKP